MNEKKISVIVPCYNCAEYLPRCMRYLLNQTIGLEYLEIILVDDASTDQGATLEALYAYEKEYPDSIIVIASSKNGRAGGARNLALQYATGEYTAFWDADDWYSVDAFEKVYAIAKKYDCDAVEFNNQDMFSLEDPLVTIRQKGDEDKIWIIETDEDRKKYLVLVKKWVGKYSIIYTIPPANYV